MGDDQYDLLNSRIQVIVEKVMVFWGGSDSCQDVQLQKESDSLPPLMVEQVEIGQHIDNEIYKICV